MTCYDLIKELKPTCNYILKIEFASLLHTLTQTACVMGVLMRYDAIICNLTLLVNIWNVSVIFKLCNYLI